jgi:hypothetical protein
MVSDSTLYYSTDCFSLSLSGGGTVGRLPILSNNSSAADPQASKQKSTDIQQQSAAAMWHSVSRILGHPCVAAMCAPTVLRKFANFAVLITLRVS